MPCSPAESPCAGIGDFGADELLAGYSAADTTTGSEIMDLFSGEELIADRLANDELMDLLSRGFDLFELEAIEPL